MTRACSLAFVAVVVGLSHRSRRGGPASDRELSLARAVEIALAESPLIKASGHEWPRLPPASTARAQRSCPLDLGESFTLRQPGLRL
jgi:hypothetical protein